MEEKQVEGRPITLNFKDTYFRLLNLFRAFDSRLEQSSKQIKSNDFRFFVLQTMLLSIQNTFETVRYLCSENLEDTRGKVEFMFSVTPLARTILDMVFNVVFIFEDFEARTQWYSIWLARISQANFEVENKVWPARIFERVGAPFRTRLWAIRAFENKI